MEFLIFSYGFTIGLAVIILFLNLILALNDFEKELNYSIIAVGVCILAYFFGHLNVFFAESTSEIIIGAKILDSSILLAAIAFLIFSYYYTKSLNKYIVFIFSAFALAFIVTTLVRPYGIMYNYVDLNYQFKGYWADEYASLPGERSFTQDLLFIYSGLYLLCIVYISSKIFRENRFSEGIQYISPILIVIAAVLVDGYIVKFHEELAFIAILILMSFRLFAKLIKSFRVEKELKHSEEKYKRLFKNSAFGIYHSGLDGRIILINSAGKNILGITDYDSIHEPHFIDKFFVENDRREYFKKILLQNGSIYNYEIELKRMDGKTIFIRDYARLVKDSYGNTIIEGAFEDISEKKQAEYLLIEAKEEAEKSNNLKSEFLAQMSHEIRTPINTILNYTGLLKADWEDNYYDDSAHFFGTIANASKRITRTIDLILNMSQLQTETYEPKFSFVNLNDILDLLVKEFVPDAEEKGLKIQLNHSYSKSLVWGDEYTITQIFANLIDNAIKYSEQGEIKIYSENKNNKLRVIFEDSGIGISEEFQKTLFEPFSQEQQGYTRKYEGNGLGLALVNKYCKLNNASIDFETELNKGTKFIVTFTIDI